MSSTTLRVAVTTATGLLEPFVGEVPDRSLGSAVPEDLRALGLMGRLHEAQVLANLAAHHAENMHVRDGRRSTAEWWAEHTRCSLPHARADVALAQRLFTGDLQATGGAVLAGRISRDQAWEVHQGTRSCSAELGAAIEAMLLIDHTKSPERLRELAAEAHRLARDEESEQDAWERRQRTRQLTVSEIGDMWVLRGLLTPEVGLMLRAVLDALGKAMPTVAGVSDQRMACQRRHDALEQALATVLSHASATQDARGKHHAPARAHFVFTAEDLAAAMAPRTSAEEALARQCCDADVTYTHVGRGSTAEDVAEDAVDDGAEPAAAEPAEAGPEPTPGRWLLLHGDAEPSLLEAAALTLVADLPEIITEAGGVTEDCSFPEDDPHDHGDHGDNSADQDDEPRPTLDTVASDLLAQCLKVLPPVFSKIPLEVLDQGRLKRFVTEGQRLALGIRDGGCVGPGCHAPPWQCHAHHIIHWLLGGPTSLHNLALLCSFHHHLVHEGGWTLRRTRDGTWEALPPQRQPLAA